MVYVLLPVIATIFAFIGIRGLVTKKATVILGKYLTFLIALCFAPQFINSAKLLLKVPFLAAITLVMYVGVIAAFWFILKNVVIFGATEENVLSSIKFALKKIGLTYKINLSSIETEKGQIFKISVQDWAGSAQIIAGNKEAKLLMPKFTHEIKAYYKNADYKINSFSYWLYAFMGVALFLMTGFLAAMLLKF